MAFQELQPAALIPNVDAGPQQASLHTLAFPAAWREPVLDLYRSTRSESMRAKIKQVPISSLNTLIRTVAPDLVTTDAYASFDATRPWLYSRTEFPPPVLARLVRAWLRGMQPSTAGFQHFRETALALDVESLRWKTETVNLLEHDLSAGGTCLPVERLYRVLPEILADRIAAQGEYEFCGERLRFYRVAVDARANGAELMSWPPLKHPTAIKGKDARARYGDHRDWYYSAVISVSLRTVPFSPIPRIYVSTRIRRWVSGSVFFSGTRRVSAYLLTKEPFVTDATQPGRFAVAQCAWDPRTREIRWAQGGAEGMLARVGAIDSLPAADVFAKEPDTWIRGRDGIEGAASYHTMMGWHGVGAGLMPAERRRLTEWAAAALEPEFTLAPVLVRSTAKQNPTKLLTPKVTVPKKDATEADIATALATNQLIELDNAVRRREYTARALDGRDLSAVLLYQSSHVRQQLINAAEASLGLADYRDQTGPDVWSWDTPDLHIRIHARELGTLGAPLGSSEQAPKKGQQHIDAIGHRRSTTAACLHALATEFGEPTTITFVELDGRDAFAPRTTDPKFAIRLGCADAGMVSQFITPGNPSDPDDDTEFRAAAAWADGLRQLGMRLVPDHSLDENIPDGLNQLAFWIVQRQTTSETERAQFTPVAVLIRPGQKTILGRTPDMTEWVPYPQLLIALTGQVRPRDLATAEQQTKAVAAFVQNTLYALRSTPTVVVTHAQNTRKRWPWLTNSGLLRDRIALGNGPAQRISLFGNNLRFARVATNDRDETPQWWAPKADESAGISKGLWKQAGNHECARVFYSTSDKSSTHTLSVESTKLTHRINAQGREEIRPDKNAWNPELLELVMLGFADDAEAEQYAIFLHQQRFAEDYRDALSLPLIQHLAELTSQYGLPHDDNPDKGSRDDVSIAEEDQVGSLPDTE